MRVTSRQDATAEQKQAFIQRQRKMRAASGVRLPPIKKQAARQASGRTLEISYLRKLNKLLAPVYKVVQTDIINALPSITEQFRNETRVDTYAETITRTFRNAVFDIGALVSEPAIAGLAMEQAEAVSSFNQRQFNRQFEAVLGVQPLRDQPFLESQMTSFTERNVALVKSVPDQLLGKVETLVRVGVESGFSTATIAAQIQREVGIAKRRARLIARDQVASFNGKLTELRQTAAGVEEYIWSTSRDARVRDRHRDLEGKVFRWDDPPVSGTRGEHLHPGMPINCRCVAIPVLDKFKRS